jgi:hypothetical protein
MTGSPVHYILIDYESIQPEDLAGIGAEAIVVVFVGAQQHRLPFDFACAMQAIGERGRYIKIAGSGRNALDFHIAFYLGELLQQGPRASFRVVSKDAGFDPLISHLVERGFDVARIEALGE